MAKVGREPGEPFRYATPRTGIERSRTVQKATRVAVKVTPQGRATNAAVNTGINRGLRSKGSVSGPRAPATPRGGRGKGASLSRRGRSVGFPSSDKRTSGFLGKAYDHSPVLLAEFFAGVVIIAIAMITRSATEKYNDVISSIMGRYTAFTAVFFVLYLMGSGGKRSSQAAAWFGLLIDLGLLFDAVNHNVFQDLSGMVTGAGLPQGVKLLSAEKPQEFFATSDIPETTVQGGAIQAGGNATAKPATPPAGNPVASPVTGGTATPPPGSGNGGVTGPI